MLPTVSLSAASRQAGVSLSIPIVLLPCPLGKVGTRTWSRNLVAHTEVYSAKNYPTRVNRFSLAKTILATIAASDRNRLIVYTNTSELVIRR